MKAGYFLVGLLCAASLVGCVHKEQVNMNPNLARAQEALDSIYQCYSRPVLICCGRITLLMSKAMLLI